MNGAEITIDYLKRRGINIIPGIPGGANLPLYDALGRSGIRHILARHEQGAGFMAQGMARATGRIAVCFATSGPGATNLLTAIADAKLDSVPVIAITGQVPRGYIGTDAFQEIDVFGMTRPITKHNYLVESAEELCRVLPEAFHIASSGRPGPVVIDIPKDVQLEEAGRPEYAENFHTFTGDEPSDENVLRIADAINRSERPVLLIGGGVISSGAEEFISELSLKADIPIACTLMGLGAVPCGHPNYLGMLGMHGAVSTNMIMNECDLLIAIGIRFDDRAIGKAEEFCPSASIIHIDIDESEIDKIMKSHISLRADASRALRRIVPLITKRANAKWRERTESIKAEHCESCKDTDPLLPENFIRRMQRAIGNEAIISTDVGQHQMWIAQHYMFHRPRQLLTSGGLGTMGFGLPAAIGAKLACQDRDVYCFTGDGSFLMNIQELAVLAETGLDVKIILFNNRGLGLVKQQQELFYGKRLFASAFERDHGFSDIARDFGIGSFRIEREDQAEGTIESFVSLKGPALLEVMIHSGHNVYPMVAPGEGNHKMIYKQQ